MNNLVKNNSYFQYLVLTSLAISVVFIFSNCNNKEESAQVFDDVKIQKEEKCISCHTPSKDMSPWHSYERIGCVSCHSGNADEEDITAAHTDMISIPGNLSSAKQSCGTAGCHPGISERVENSLMTTMSGVVNIQRWYFGESDDLNKHVHVKDLTYSPADSYTRNLCASCHLGREKIELGPINEKSRGGGCNACHLNYSNEAKKQLEDWVEGDPMHFHPSLDLNISNDHCFGCHSRSGRLSTSYEGWHESQLKEIPEKDSSDFRRLEDKRIFVKITEDIHHTYGLDCIDCHNGMEVMGDGKKYYHAEDAVMIRCDDCHFNEPPKTASFDELDFESSKIVSIREHLNEKMNFVLNKKKNYPLVNVIEENGNHYMIGKNNAEKYALSKQSAVCSKGNVHEDLSCSSCHSAWTPQCIKCHVSYDPERSSFDLLAREKVQGKWIEKGGHFLADLPTLGIMDHIDEEGNINRRIETFVPGMIIESNTSDHINSESDDPRFARLFAPIEAHTTTKEGRSCKSCHFNPNAIGYGRGELRADTKKGSIDFDPLYPILEQDGLPADAWIGLFEEPADHRTTRINGRPFNSEEQKKILRIGICLQCHADDSKIMQRTLDDFDKQLFLAVNRPECNYKK